MRKLDEIKQEFVKYHFRPEPNEIEFYNIDETMVKTWNAERAEKLSLKLFNSIKEFHEKISLGVNNKESAKYLADIIAEFYLCVDDDIYFDNFYDKILDFYKLIYEGDYFDFLSYKSFSPFEEEYHNKIMFAKYDFVRKEPKEKKYGGIIPKYYLLGHKKIFEDALNYFAKIIYQKYGLYLQYSMEILIKFCIDFNLPYVEMLKEAQKTAIEKDYPNKYKYKYQFIDRRKEKWGEIKELKPRELDLLISLYVRDNVLPDEISWEYYHIDDNVLKNWKTIYGINKKNELKIKVLNFKDNIFNSDNKNEIFRQTLLIDDIFFDATLDRNYDNEFYGNTLDSFKLMYEYNMFDFMSIEPIGDYGIKELDKSFADFNDIKNHRYSVHNNIITTDNKYVGIIPSYYYCGHLEEFNKLLLYFANTIFKKYGLYFQHSMSVLIEFCKDYKLPYLKILYKALKEAKNIDYSKNHSFNYDGFNIRKKVDWYL